MNEHGVEPKSSANDYVGRLSEQVNFVLLISTTCCKWRVIFDRWLWCACTTIPIKSSICGSSSSWYAGALSWWTESTDSRKNRCRSSSCCCCSSCWHSVMLSSRFFCVYRPNLITARTAHALSINYPAPSDPVIKTVFFSSSPYTRQRNGIVISGVCVCQFVHAITAERQISIGRNLVGIA